MGAEAHAGGYGIIVEYAQHAEIHSLPVAVAGKAEGVVGVEPAVAGVAAGVGGGQDSWHDKSGKESGELPVAGLIWVHT
ncbi:hypothetical protein GCM10022408_21910 [Hymenobacter fastidiosus]|uniref:Uncharacterized protein n=1 Tax=Hymenobacter fastidiosus TaxID=486264 RepID=A0ABP7SBD9_9BACT